MKARCPNCDVLVQADAKACGHCGASFGTGAWKPVPVHEEAQEDAGSPGAGPEGAALLAAGAGLLAWLIPLALAAVSQVRTWGSLRGLWRGFLLELQFGRIALALALFAVLTGLLVLALTRARLKPWTGLVSGALLLAIAAPALPKNPYLRPLLEYARVVKPVEVPKFVPMNDGRWWDCGGIMRGKVSCAPDSAPATALLRPDEKELLAKFDALPKPPAALSEEQVIALMGRAPTRRDKIGPLTVLDWSGFSVDSPGEGKINISIGFGQLYEIQWIEPKRFFLQKINDLKESKPVEGKAG